MKFWKQIFLACIGLFLCLYFTAGFLLIERIHGEKMGLSIKTSMNKFTEIENILYWNSDYGIYEDFQNEAALADWLKIIINGYNASNELGTFEIEIFNCDNKQLMKNSSLKIPSNRDEIIHANNERSFIIRKIGEERYIFVSGIINLNNKELKLVVSNQITSLTENKMRDYRFFILIGIGMTLIMSICLYIITKQLTDPIEKLSKVSNDIRRGDYSKRVDENGTSREVSILQRNFNQMIDDMQIQMLKLEHINESKQRFIDSLNHEIKTPITSILGYSDILMKGKVSKEIEQKALGYINQEAKRLELINSTLLKLIVIQQIDEGREKVSVLDTIKVAEGALNFKIEQRNIQIKVDVRDTYIYMNRNEFQLLLINFIDNAIKASKQDSSIEIYGKLNFKFYELWIQDHGIGIPKEDLDNIFEAFYMVDKARTRKENGLGLGLTICDEICKRYHIKVKIESEVNKGTKIILNLPIDDKD